MLFIVQAPLSERTNNYLYSLPASIQMLTITLTPPAAYGAGDLVTGKVTYISPTADTSSPATSKSDPIRLLVQLTGHTETHVRSAHHSRAELLQLPFINIYSADTELSCAFSFPFPGTCVAVGSVSPLPPSFTGSVEEEVGKEKLSSRGAVKYAISASIWIQTQHEGDVYGVKGVKSIRVCEQSVPVAYRRAATSIQEDTKKAVLPPIIRRRRPFTTMLRTCVVRSFDLLPDRRGSGSKSGSSSPEPLKEKDIPVQIPHFDFDVFLLTPIHAVLDQEMEFMVNILPAPKTSTAPLIPQFWARRYRVQLVAITRFSAPYSSSRGTVEAAEKNTVYDVEDSNWNVLLSSENGYTARLTVSMLAADVIPPAFSTNGISRRYELHLEVGVECAGEAFPVSRWNHIDVFDLKGCDFPGHVINR
jgi:hypothetical protein